MIGKEDTIKYILIIIRFYVFILFIICIIKGGMLLPKDSPKKESIIYRFCSSIPTYKKLTNDII